MSVAIDTVTAHEQRATTAGNKFRELARTTQNPATKLLTEGLIALAEALRKLDAKLEKIELQARSRTS